MLLSLNDSNNDLLFCRLCLEEMAQWSQSLESLLSSKCKSTNNFFETLYSISMSFQTLANSYLNFPMWLGGMKIFQAFLKSEFSDENLEFWVVCEDYKKIRTSFRMSSRAKKIFKLYIQAEAPREVCTALFNFVYFFFFQSRCTSFSKNGKVTPL